MAASAHGRGSTVFHQSSRADDDVDEADGDEYADGVVEPPAAAFAASGYASWSAESSHALAESSAFAEAAHPATAAGARDAASTARARGVAASASVFASEGAKVKANLR